MIYVVAYYILSTLLYIGIGTSSIHWACFNMISVLGSMFIFLHYPKPKTQSFQILSTFAAYLTVGRIIYTLSCSYAPIEWIYKTNVIFVIIYILWLIIHITTHRNGGQKLI